MSELFKAKSKNYRCLIDSGEEQFAGGGKQLVRPAVVIKFANFEYVSRPEGELSEEEVIKRLHNSLRYNIDFVSCAPEEVKRQAGDYKVREDLQPCEYCGRKEFKSLSSRTVHVVSCEKKYKDEAKELSPGVIVGTPDRLPE